MRSNETPRADGRDWAELDSVVARAMKNARAKNARLKLLKERHEIYLESRRAELLEEEEYLDDADMPREL